MLARTAPGCGGFGDDGEPPQLDPILLAENTDTGWRALTASGEVLEVSGPSGKPPPTVTAGERISFGRGDEIIGQRTMPAPTTGQIGLFLAHYNAGCSHYMRNELGMALVSFNMAISIANTARARWNRGLVELSCGNWERGLADFEARHEFRPHVSTAPRWQGEDLTGKTLILEHELGYGDTIMALRFVPFLQQRCHVVLNMPSELAHLASQMIAPIAGAAGAAYALPIMSLLYHLKVRPDNVPTAPYLKPDPALMTRWRSRLPMIDAARIGVAWSVGNLVENDYPRSIPLDALMDRLRAVHPRAQFYSLQLQGGDEAEREQMQAWPFEDFADCAALIALMDEVYAIDTAALHLAGAIGHGRVTALLSHWHSWRWRAPWYPRVNFVTQAAPGDWSSALAQITAP